MPSTPASQERVDLEFGLLFDPHPGLTSRQITDRVMVAIGKEFGDIGITNVRTTPRSAAFGDRPAGPVPINPDWAVNVGKAGSAETVTGNPMTMTSGATGQVRVSDDQRLLDAIALSHHYSKLGGLDDDKDKAASRHARHHQSAIKAVGGARQLLGSAIAEPLAEHVRALAADVDKASSIAAGYASLVKSLLTELGATRRQADKLRRDEAEAIGTIVSTVGTRFLGEKPTLGVAVNLIAAEHAEQAFTARWASYGLALLAKRPTVREHAALQARVTVLEKRIQGAAAAYKINHSTARGWIVAGENAQKNHLVDVEEEPFDQVLRVAMKTSDPLEGPSALAVVANASRVATTSSPTANA